MNLNALADHLDELALRTWYNVAQAKRLGMRMGEVTITEANLLSIAQFIEATGLSVELVPTRADEAVTGADFEIWFDTPASVVGYTFQAKVLTAGIKSFSYREIGKRDQSGIEQAELLERHALEIGAFPFHVLFNGWAAGLPHAPTLPTQWPAEHFGCAAIATPQVQRIRRSVTRRLGSAEHYLPSALPWSQLFRPPPTCQAGASTGYPRCISGIGAEDGSSRVAAVDVARLRSFATQLMGDHYDFGFADRLPTYARPKRDSEAVLVDHVQSVPRFVIVIRPG